MLKSKYPIRELTDLERVTLKQTLLEIYKDILYVCTENNIVCFLGGGSCLGAVRHNGFIPWDDDLDLLLFRHDYEKLPSLLNKYYGDKYAIIGPHYIRNNPFNFIKVEKKGTLIRTLFDDETDTFGIAIDIFPIDSIPSNRLSNLIHGIILNSIFYIAICTKLYQKPTMADKVLFDTKEGKKKLLFRKIVGFLFSWFHYSKWMLIGDKIASKSYKSEVTAIPSGRLHYFGEIHNLQVYFPPIKKSFEGIESFIPNDYDKYLSALYGDYMQIPPPEKREKHFIVDIKF